MSLWLISIGLEGSEGKKLHFQQIDVPYGRFRAGNGEHAVVRADVYSNVENVMNS